VQLLATEAQDVPTYLTRTSATSSQRLLLRPLLLLSQCAGEGNFDEKLVARDIVVRRQTGARLVHSGA